MSNLNLMVGDWVTCYKKDIPVKVKEILSTYIITECEVHIAPLIANYDIQPIPLTPDVMEKIENISKNENRGTRYGFLDGYYNIDRDTDLVAIFEDDGLLYIYTYEYSHEQFQLVCTFQYLHQLQQLIRLFTGK